jgi:uncharacterized membrane protein YhaH (DUF805 family)
MGAFGEIFGFDGRVSRMGYLWRSALAVFIIAVIAGLAVWTMTYALAPEGLAGPVNFENDVITGAVLLVLWSSFALATRRLRDMGVEPVYVVPIYAALWVVNSALLEPLSQLQPARFGAVEGGWMALQWLIAIPLIFWPPSNRARPAPPGYQPVAESGYLNWRESA